MAYNYDELYGTNPHALGAPTQVFVDFFYKLDAGKLRVLDIGCGQGRDAVFIARRGHSVVGVDLSPNGIGDLRAAAAAEGLDIQGIVVDIVDFVPKESFDIVLIDRTLHMLDPRDRIAVLARLITAVPFGGWVLIADEASNIVGFKGVFAASTAQWSPTLEKGGTLFVRRD